MLDDSWSIPGSPLSTSVDEHEHGYLVEEMSNTATKDASGHLMVPSLNGSHRKSDSSNSASSADMDNHSLEIPQDQNSQVLVK
jgi:hypothetical protein